MADEAAATASTWSPMAMELAVCNWYGPYYYSLLTTFANFDQPPRAKRRKVEVTASTPMTSESTTTRLLFDRRGRVTFKPYSDIRLDSSLSNHVGECQPLKRRLGEGPHTSGLNQGQHKGQASKKAQIIQPDRGCTIGNLFPEVLSMIFEYLDVQSKGRVAQVRN